MAGDASAKGLITDFTTSLAFCTRLPLVHSAFAEGADIARASWAFPLVGAVVGLLGGLVCWIAASLGLHPFLSGVLALGTTMFATGCLHEDGLADTADGLGGGATPQRKMEIMRDSGIGAYGAAALTLSMMLRAGAIASLAGPGLMAAALFAAHAGSRAVLPALMRIVPPARADGLSAQAGRPPLNSVVAAALIGMVALIIGLGFSGALIAAALVAIATYIIGRLCITQIGGQTGDVLGAVEQVGEILILLVAAAWLK
jgi:adenosylcobinamide-GDP ribazoletransferase